MRIPKRDVTSYLFTYLRLSIDIHWTGTASGSLHGYYNRMAKRGHVTPPWLIEFAGMIKHNDWAVIDSAIFNNQWNEKSSFPASRWIDQTWLPVTTSVDVYVN